MKGFYKKMAGLDFKIKFLIVLCALILVSILASGSVKAAYQSRPGFTALVSVTADTFFENIRAMETSGGSLGLSAKLNSDYTDSTGNGVDVHMMKNSEWGATIMLALSGYGGGTQATVGTYTTGSSNYTGVYGMGNGNWEYMATMTVDSSGSVNETSNYTSIFEDDAVNSRYYDSYYVDSTIVTSSSSNDEFYKLNYKTLLSSSGTGYLDHYGDAIYETVSLLTSYAQSGYHYNTTLGGPFFIRGYSGSGGVLAFNGYDGGANSGGASRAVVVCGSGL